jgi:hypothetical protein
MAGGGVIIIRSALQMALTDPLVHGQLPESVQKELEPFIQGWTSAWTTEQTRIALAAFSWAGEHCTA